MNHRENLSLANIEGEIWKDIQGYESLYQISNFGRVKSLKRITIRKSHGALPVKERILRQSIHKYFFVQLNKDRANTHFIHKLIGRHFIPNPENKPQINHINGIKDDNRIENLEWCTAKENTDHAWRIGLSHKMLSSNHKQSKKTIQFTLSGEKIKEWNCASDAARELGIHKGNIAKTARGLIHQSGGFKWQYA